MNKITGVKALAFTSMLASITILLVLFTTYLSGVGLLSMIIIPMCASFVSLKVDWRYRLVYFCSCLITFLLDPSLTLFIVIPCLLSGIILGELISKYIHGYYIIFFTTILVTVLQIGSTYLVNSIFEVDMIELFSVILKIDYLNFSILFYLFLYILSLIQVSLSYVIITNELKKLNYEFNEKRNQFIQIFIISLISLSLSFIFFFINHTIFYLLFGISVYFSVILGSYIFSFYQKKKMLLIQLPLYFISLIIFAILYNIVGNANSIVLLMIPFVTHIISGLYIIIFQFFFKKGGIYETLFDKLN